jgi:hypothetical protein
MWAIAVLGLGWGGAIALRPSIQKRDNVFCMAYIRFLEKNYNGNSYLWLQKILCRTSL